MEVTGLDLEIMTLTNRAAKLSKENLKAYEEKIPSYAFFI
jgi:hypothetical protein